MRLDEGLREAPPVWHRCWVIDTPRPIDREQLAASVPGSSIEEDPLFEPLSYGAMRGPPAVLRGAPQARALWPDDPAFVGGLQWGLFSKGDDAAGARGLDIGAPEAWARTTGSPSLLLAVLDTGVDPDHPDLQEYGHPGGPRLSAYSAIPAGGPDQAPDVADSIGHGTMVCGVMAARTNNGPTRGGGMAGVAGGDGDPASGPRILSLKITSGKGSTARGTDLARAVVLAVESGARAINISFASPARSSALRAALYWAASRGCVVICGAGNTADDRPQYPAAYAEAGLAVAATAAQRDGGPAPFDTRGSWIDCAAPGVDVLSTWPGYENAYGSTLRDFATASGTSFAAPFVTGMAALALSVDSSLAAGDFRELLRRSVRHLGGPDSSAGLGFADAPRLLAALSPPHRLVHGEAAAESWREAGVETLRLRGTAFWRAAGAADGDYPAWRYEVRAVVRGSVALDSAATWIRTPGAGGWRPGELHDGEECWGESIGETEDGATLRAYVYRIDVPPAGCDSCPPIGWLPRPPWEVVLPWTRWGEERFAIVSASRLRIECVSSLPARGTVRFRVTGLAGESLDRVRGLDLFDVRGRAVKRLRLASAGGGSAVAAWEGKDEAGRIAPAGLYFARYQDGAMCATTRLVWLR